MPPLHNENTPLSTPSRDAFRTPALPIKTKQVVRHLRSSSSLTASGLRAPRSQIPLSTRKSFEGNALPLADWDKSTSLDKSIIKDHKQTHVEDKIRELEKSMRATVKAVKHHHEGAISANEVKVDSRMLALENRVANLEEGFEALKVAQSVVEAPKPETTTFSPTEASPGMQAASPVLKARFLDHGSCASPPVPALAKRMSWTGGMDSSFQKRLFNLDDNANPFGNRRGSGRRSNAGDLSIGNVSFESVMESTEDGLTKPPTERSDTAPPARVDDVAPGVADPDSQQDSPGNVVVDQVVLDAIKSLELRAASADERIESLKADKLELQASYAGLKQESEAQANVSKAQSDDILALRKEIEQLRSLIPAHTPVPGIEGEFSKLYLLELGRRAAAEAIVLDLQAQIAALQSITALVKTAVNEAKENEKEAKTCGGVCGACDACEAGDVSLIDASI